MAQQTPQEPVAQSFRLRVDWRVADGYPISYANEFMLQTFRDEFVITLGQLALPAIVNPTPEEVEALPKTISPVVVARVAVTPGSLKRLIELLQRQLGRYESGDVRGLSEVSDMPGGGQEA
jgi:hypothetical protein